jgi:hypothetical protein
MAADINVGGVLSMVEVADFPSQSCDPCLLLYMQY